MRNALKALAVVVCLALMAQSASAIVIERSYEINLFDLNYGVQGDGVTLVAYTTLPVDPFTFAAVGDQLITTVMFSDNHRLRLWDGSQETVQIQYLGGGSQGSRSLQEVELLGVTGNYIGSSVHVYDQQFGCGNCLIAFTQGDLTTSQFSFEGIRVTTTITDLTLGGPYSSFWFEAFAEHIDIRPVPEPSTLALFGLGLAGLGFARRRKHA